MAERNKEDKFLIKDMNNPDRVLDISWETILKVVLVFVCFYILYLIRDILVWIIFALIISVLFNPAIDFLKGARVPRVVATILVYVTIFGTLGIFIYLIASVFIAEIEQFSQLLPQYFTKISPILGGLGIEAFETFEGFVQLFQDWLSGAAVNILGALSAIFGGIFATITIFTLALFLSLEEKGSNRIVALLSPKKYEAFTLFLWERSQRKVAGWFGTRVLCCFFVGLMTFTACYVLNIRYAISFGLLAGILNIVPIVGPIITGLILTVFAALDSYLKAVFILITFIIIQQIENNILTPVLTKKFIGLPPALVLIALLVGGKLWGILGAILAVPLAGILFEFLRDFLKKRKDRETIVL